MPNVAIEKFIDRLGIQYSVNPSRSYILNGKEHVCIKIVVTHKRQKQFEQYICFSKGSNGRASWEESNTIIGSDQGVFAYLGDRKSVDNYFYQKARDFADLFFENVD